METYPYYATVLFPEFFEKPGAVNEFREDRGTLCRGSFTFTREGYFIQARIDTGLPDHVLDIPEVKEKWILPVTNLIRQDVESIADLLPRFRELARAKKIQDALEFSRPYGSSFKVYDYSRNTPGLCEIVKRLKRIPIGVIKPELVDLAKMSGDIQQDGTEVPHVRGSSLREAAAIALKIYENGERLAEIRFD